MVSPSLLDIEMSQPFPRIGTVIIFAHRVLKASSNLSVPNHHTVLSVELGVDQAVLLSCQAQLNWIQFQLNFTVTSAARVAKSLHAFLSLLTVLI